MSICVWVQVCATMCFHILGINVASKFDAITMTVVEGRFTQYIRSCMERKERRPILKRDLAHMILIQKFVKNLFTKFKAYAMKILIFRI